MTTIVNTPAPTSQSNGMPGMILGLVTLAVVLYILFIYGLPAINNLRSPQITVPDKVDININQPLN
jgi:hypothetical protein